MPVKDATNKPSGRRPPASQKPIGGSLASAKLTSGGVGKASEKRKSEFVEEDVDMVQRPTKKVKQDAGKGLDRTKRVAGHQKGEMKVNMSRKEIQEEEDEDEQGIEEDESLESDGWDGIPDNTDLTQSKKSLFQDSEGEESDSSEDEDENEGGELIEGYQIQDLELSDEEDIEKDDDVDDSEGSDEDSDAPVTAKNMEKRSKALE
ncbi:hypothetical protein FRC18_007127, partial [Serendipita sp. 400]